MSQRRRRGQPRTIQDFVRAGVLRPVQPTTASGWCRYGTGREFLPAATNYATNPSYTTDTNSDGCADGVTTDALNGTPTYALSSVNPAKSGKVQRVQYTGVGADGATAYIKVCADTASGSFVEADPATASVYLKLTTSGLTQVDLYLGCFTAANAYVGGSAVLSAAISDVTTWTRVSVVKPACPATTAYVRFMLRIQGMDEGDTIDVSFANAQVEKSATISTYFDGSYADCAWSGTAHASTSTRTVSALTVPVSLSNTAWTVAGRYTVPWAHNDSLAHNLLTLYATSDARATVYKHTDQKLYASVTDGTDTVTSASAASTLAANTVNTFVASSTWAATVDSMINGAASTQGDASAVAAQAITAITIGGTPCGYVGPLIVSPEDKAAGWKTAISASSGAAFSSVATLVRDFMDDGDYIIPCVGDATAYVRASGGGLPFEMGRYSGTEYTTATYGAGDGVVALRFDDNQSLDYTYIYPALTSRGLVGGFAAVASWVGGSAKTTATQLRVMQENGMEIMCHSYTHPDDPADWAEYVYETKTAAEALRAMGLDIASFVQPGSWMATANITSTAFYGTLEDQLLRANFSAYEGYIGSAYRTLPIFGDGRFGSVHITGDTYTLAQLRTVVDTVITNGTGIRLLFHPARIGTAGCISEADFESFLDYIETKVGTGDVTNLTPTQLNFATVG